jgi:hypothetical protein
MLSVNAWESKSKKLAECKTIQHDLTNQMKINWPTLYFWPRQPEFDELTLYNMLYPRIYNTGSFITNAYPMIYAWLQSCDFLIQ